MAQLTNFYNWIFGRSYPSNHRQKILTKEALDKIGILPQITTDELVSKKKKVERIPNKKPEREKEKAWVKVSHVKITIINIEHKLNWVSRTSIIL